jgi:acetyl/propionyl-CoA carboxylase alpha subunit
VKLSFSHAGQHHAIEIQQNGREYKASKDGESVVAGISDTAPGEIHLHVNRNDRRVLWARQGRKIWLHFDGRSYYVEKQAGSAVAGGAAASGERTLRAPMPGQVRQVLVKDGQEVKSGETLVLLEAMKMEIRIQAPGDGKVARVAVKQGQSVEKEQVLVELDT